MSATLRAIRPVLRVSSGARFFSGNSHGGVPCAGHDAPYHELNEGAKPLKAVLEGAPKAFVYFTASWCGPCRKIAPFFSDLAAEHGGSVQFVKVDVDANQETAEAVRDGAEAPGAPRPPPPPPRPHHRALPPPPQTQAKVSSIPTFVSFVGGKPTATFTGANPASLTAAVKALL